MIRWFLSALTVLCVATTAAQAHFVFVVPDGGGATAKVVFSETLEPDGDVDASFLEKAKFACRPAGGTDAPLALAKGKHAYTTPLPGGGPRVAHGVAPFGVTKRGEGEPFLLVYHPKAVVGGNPFDPAAALGDAAPVEIVPAGKPGALQFEVRIKGKPVAAGVEVVVLPPGEDEIRVKTGDDGRTQPFAKPGQYGAWARSFEPTKGEHDGKPYAQTRRYASLVVDAPDASKAAAAEDAPAAGKSAHAAVFPPLPEAVSSFGATVCDGHLYVYGGHIAKTHSYSTTAVSGRFHRLNLADGAKAKWEELPGGPKIQGMNLATHGGKVYRVGGMEPRNAPGTPADNYSLTTASQFDPKAGKWADLPPLPEGRSSHDVVVVGDTLMVVGGWVMTGREGGNRWPESAWAMDLSAEARGEKLAWKSVKQPFGRRALMAVPHNGKLYALGGFTEHDDAEKRVDIYDPKTGEWSTGPEFPGRDRNGFAPAATTAGGRLYLSVADGSLLRLTEAGDGWEKVAATTPRIVHRLAPWQSQILILGGAARGNNLDLIEAVTVAPAAPAAAQAAGQ